MKQTNSKSAPAKKAASAKETAPAKKAAASKTTAEKSSAPIKETTSEKKVVPAEKKADKVETPVAQPEQKVSVVRYSDDELTEFKTLINDRLQIAREELQFLQGQMIGKDPSGVEDSSDLRLSLEDGSGAMDREQLSQLTSRQVQYISNLEKALIRIHNKTYGVCRETGKLIDKARLRAVPHATLSIEAKMGGKKKN